MLTVVIPVDRATEGLPHVLNSLVPAAASGLVRDVIISDCGGTRDAFEIADAAGCHFSGGHSGKGAAARAGAQSGRGDWLLFLSPSSELQAGWEMHVHQFLERVERSGDVSRAATFRLSVDGFGWKARLQEWLAALRSGLFGLPAGAQGLLIPRRFYSRIGGHRPLDRLEDLDLARRIGQHRITLLKSAVSVLSEDEIKRPGISSLWNGFCLALFRFGLPTQLLIKLYA